MSSAKHCREQWTSHADIDNLDGYHTNIQLQCAMLTEQGKLSLGIWANDFNSVMTTLGLNFQRDSYINWKSGFNFFPKRLCTLMETAVFLGNWYWSSVIIIVGSLNGPKLSTAELMCETCFCPPELCHTELN